MVLLFFSCISEDSDKFQVKKIAESLTDYPQIDDVIFYERNIDSDFTTKIDESIKKCDIFLLICSQNALKSNLIGFEWGAAISYDKIIIPIFKDTKDIPILLGSKVGVLYKKDAIIRDIHQLIVKNLDQLSSYKSPQKYDQKQRKEIIAIITIVFLGVFRVLFQVLLEFTPYRPYKYFPSTQYFLLYFFEVLLTIEIFNYLCKLFTKEWKKIPNPKEKRRLLNILYYWLIICTILKIIYLFDVANDVWEDHMYTKFGILFYGTIYITSEIILLFRIYHHRNKVFSMIA